MLISSISNSKLHCCLAALILFILIFLSLPLLLIYLANTNYEKCHRNPAPAQASSTANWPLSSKAGSGQQLDSNGGSSLSVLDSGGAGSYDGENCVADHEQATVVAATNCTQYAFQADLSLSDENFHCPIGTFPCSTCPDICIEQWRNCDGHADCPDRSDENLCHDSNGAIGIIFQSIVNIQNISNKSSGAAGSGGGGGGNGNGGGVGGGTSGNGGGSSSSTTSAFAKPESCTLEQFVAEQCPCVYTDPRVIICDNLGLTSVPSTLLSSVYKIRMSNNSISNIDNVLWPRSLSSLVLVNNHITHIGRSTFETAPSLSKLYLSHNEISYIDSEAFTGLSSLTSLQIEANKLRTFDSKMLLTTPMITKIYLSENMIDLPDDTRFGDCQNLKELFLDHNRISTIRSRWFSNMTSLIWLSLMHNEISVIEDGAFDWNYELEELNLSFNRIKFINRQTFARRLNIQRLYLGGNPLQPLPVDAFRELIELKSLNLTHVHFDHILNGTFSYLTKLEFIYFAKFRYCHYANHVRVCRPSTDGLSSVEDLLAFPILKYAVWIVASVCSLGNVFVFIWRSVSPHEDCTLSLFVRNLSIADLMMGIYLGAIGWQDWKYQHKFGLHAIDWMSSWACTSIGFLAILSSELSVFILTIITIERYRSIISIETFEEEAPRKRRARFYVAVAWILSFLIACYPLVEWLSKNSDYYATNGLCLPLHIDQPYTPGWQYSAFIYLGINFSAVVVIIVLYVHMYSMIMKVQKASKPALLKAEKREDAILAIRFFFIVVTDCLCWIPIVVIKVMALANVSISSSIYGWLVVFIIPINSALNPIVYTLAAPTSLRVAVCRLFERICYKVDMLAGNGGCDSNYSTQSSTSGSRDSDSGHHVQANAAATAGKRRKKTGSNSTTCDTIDTSISSQQSRLTDGGAEFAAIIHNGATGAHNCPSHGSLSTSTLMDSRTKRLSQPIYHGGGGVGADDSTMLPIAVDDQLTQRDGSVRFCQRCHLNAITESAKDNRPYEYLTTYDEDGPIMKHQLISNRLLLAHPTDDKLAVATVMPRASGRLGTLQSPDMPAYEALERRQSFGLNEDTLKEGRYQNLISRGYKSSMNRRRFTNPGFVNEEFEELDDTLGQVELQMSGGGLDAMLDPAAAAAVEKSHSHPSNTNTAPTNSILIDLRETHQIAASPRQSRVSFSSKDSRTCLLSQTDSC